MDQKTKTTSNSQPVNYIAGLVLGSVVAAGTTFLYKTKKGKRIRHQLKHHYKAGRIYLKDTVEAIKQQTESTLSSNEVLTNLENAKKRLVKISPLPGSFKPKKKTFLKAGRPLVK
jgi:gas vesicle protein